MSDHEKQNRRLDRPETEKERLDRELIELLNELRVILPGVQVLFAFLLTVPFNNRFADITAAQKGTYFLAVLCTAVSAAFLIAPPNYHRILFRSYEKERLVYLSNRFTVIGTASLAVAITAVMFLITDLLYHEGPAIAVTAGTALLVGALWFALPLGRRRRLRQQGETFDDGAGDSGQGNGQAPGEEPDRTPAEESGDSSAGVARGT